MSYNLSQLTDYTKEYNLPLIKKSLFGSRTAEIIRDAGTIQTGIKSSAALNLFETDAILQSGNCEFTPSGSTQFSQRELKVADIKVNETLCPRELEKKWTQYEVTQGSAPESVPFEQDYTGRKAAQVARKLENLVWSGDTAGGDLFDGFLTHLGATAVTASVINPAITPAAITKTNVEEIIDSVYEAIPSDVIANGDVTIFVGDDTYRKYTQALKESNLFHFAPEGGNLDYVYPGDSRVTISAVFGLNDSDNIVAAKANNMFIGVDLENEDEEFDLWYSMDNRQVRFAMDFKYGTQIAYPEQVVHYLPA